MECLAYISLKTTSAASDEIDQFELVALAQGDAGVTGLRYHLAIKLDRDARGLHLQRADERGQPRVALDDVGVAIELDGDFLVARCVLRGHLKSRFLAPGKRLGAEPRSLRHPGFPYAGISRIRFEGSLVQARSQCLAAHPQPDQDISLEGATVKK